MDRTEASALLHRAGVKPTAPRIDIACELFAQPQHLSADQLHARLRAAGRECARATVYNTLGLFARHGLAREVVVDPTRVYYDSTPGPHHHFYNVDTGELSDISPDDVALERMPALPAGTEHAGTDVVVRVRQVKTPR